MVEERGAGPESKGTPAGDAPDDAGSRRFRVRRVIAPRAEDGDRVESRDETEVGWGDAPGRRDDDWYRRERPPHHE